MWTNEAPVLRVVSLVELSLVHLQAGMGRIYSHLLEQVCNLREVVGLHALAVDVVILGALGLVLEVLEPVGVQQALAEVVPDVRDHGLVV